MPDPYSTLQVDRRAEAEVIAAAYRSLARKYHPDKNASETSTKRMQELNAAYEILGDPAKRRAYDRVNAHPAGRVLWRDPDAMVWGGASGREGNDRLGELVRAPPLAPRAHPAQGILGAQPGVHPVSDLRRLRVLAGIGDDIAENVTRSLDRIDRIIFRIYRRLKYF